jgi:hypothetical protein
MEDFAGRVWQHSQEPTTIAPEFHGPFQNAVKILPQQAAFAENYLLLAHHGIWDGTSVF